MNRVLVIVEIEADRLSDATAATIACAAAIPDSQLDVAVLADDRQRSAEAAATLSDVSKVLLCDDAAHSPPAAAMLAPRIAELATDYTHIIGPSSTFGRDLMPQVAALIGCAQISDVMAVESAQRFTRPIYAGNILATVETQTLPVVLTARAASWQQAPGTQDPAPIEAIALQCALPDHTRVLERSATDEARIDLQSARRVVAGGRGVGSAENFAAIEKLAAAIKAAVGASRAAVDAGFAANEQQVGQTGRIIAPSLYIAAGISGAIQHVTGIRDAGTIVAINNDPDAPIHKIADISLVADLFAVIPELTDKLS